MVRLLGGDYNPQHLCCWQSKAETAASWDSGDLSTAAPTPGPLLTQSLPGTCLQLPLAPNTRRVILNASQTCCFTPQMAGSQTLSISPFTLKKKSQNQILLQTARVREQLWLEPHSRRREHTPCHCSTLFVTSRTLGMSSLCTQVNLLPSPCTSQHQHPRCPCTGQPGQDFHS